MLQALRKTWRFAVFAAMWGTVAHASVALNGVYKGDLGQVEFQTEQGHVTGYYTAGGRCNFDPNRPIIDGEFEGRVLVGRITVCQTGTACDERAYSVLAFYNPVDGSLSANMKLEPGCDSPALNNSRLVLQVARADEVQKAPRTVLAKGHKVGKKQREDCLNALKRGQRLLERRDYAGASFYFEQGLACDEQNWAAYLGIAVAELRRGNPQRALASLQKSKENTQSKDNWADIYYNMACVNARLNDKRAAIENLNDAIALGWSDPTAMNTDPDLQLLKDDPGFKAVLDRAWDVKDRQRAQEH